MITTYQIKWLAAVAITSVFLAVGAVAQAAAPLPVFDADNFSHPTKINNPWFSLPIGKEMEFEGETEDGLEHIEIEITGDTKVVMGIKALIYRDRVWVDGELVEDTRDYVAQDDDGNVWYLGEDVDNFEDGKLKDHGGAWLAGVDGAKPGYWMPANPKVGDSYRQEYYAGEAEDEAKVLSLNAKVKTELGTYTNCLKTADTTPLEPDVLEYKYYCQQVGGLVLEEKPEDDERVELIEWEIEDSTDDDDEDDDAFDDDDDSDDEDDDNSTDVHSLQVRLVALLQQLLSLLLR